MSGKSDLFISSTTDIETLRGIVVSQRAEIRRLTDQVRDLTQELERPGGENELLERQVRDLTRELEKARREIAQMRSKP